MPPGQPKMRESETDQRASARADANPGVEHLPATLAHLPPDASAPPIAPTAPLARPPGLLSRLLTLSVFYKVLLANSAIVLIGALAGTAITLHVATNRAPAMLDVPLAAIFAVVGLLLTGILNALVLRAALAPLKRLQDVARRVQQGDLSVRAEPSPLADAEITRLANILNQILDDSQRYEEQLRALSGNVIRAQEEERQRIARELHDDTGQVLTLLLIRLKLLESHSGADALNDQLAELRGLVSGAIEQVRQLALNLRPPSLDQLGLVPALRSLISTYTANTGIVVKFEAPREPVRLSPERTIAVYRIAQEALTNAAKHAGARNVILTLDMHDGSLRLAVRDDGRGFDPTALARPTARPAAGGPGVGLFGMEERARLASGTLRITSSPGRGTSISLNVPSDGETQPTPRDEKAGEA